MQDSADCRSSTKKFKRAAVVTDSKVSSDIGRDIMSKGGNAVDAAVGALLANGVLSVHSCGIGGGSLYVLYMKSTDQKWYAVDSRETAPQGASENMYMKTSGGKVNSSLVGGMAVATPGEVRGLFEVHSKFGKLPWKDIVTPTADLCKNGVPISSAVHHAFKLFLDSRDMRNTFPEYFDGAGNLRGIGELIKLPIIEETFRTIAKNPMSFYEGPLAEKIVADIRDAGGIIGTEDLKNYSIRWQTPSVMHLPGNVSIYSSPTPGSGPVLGYILNILSGYNFSSASVATTESSTLTYHRVVEAMKFAFAERSKLGDVEGAEGIFHKLQRLDYGETTRKKIKDDNTQEIGYYQPAYQVNGNHGTAHISVIDADGNAVSVTSTINTYFGSQVRGKRTGIIFNNEMNDFSTPDMPNYYGFSPSPANFIRPGKRPMSSMCPAIVFDSSKKKIKLVTGAAGGSTITTLTAMNIMDVLWFGRSLSESIDRPRIHHQLFPAEIQVEAKRCDPKLSSNFQALLEGLKTKGHKLRKMHCKSVLQAAQVCEDGIVAVADFRKGGEPSGL